MIAVVVGVIVPVMIAVVIRVGDGVSRGDGATGVSINGGIGASTTGGGITAIAVWVAAASMVRAKSVLVMSTVGGPKGDSR